MTESKKSESNKHDVLSKKSDSKGLLGLFETFIRRFRTISFLILLMPVVFLCLCALGLSLAPALAFFYFIQNQIGDIHPVLHYIILGLAFATSYMIYGVSLVFVVPLLNFIFPIVIQVLNLGHYQRRDHRVYLKQIKPDGVMFRAGSVHKF